MYEKVDAEKNYSTTKQTNKKNPWQTESHPIHGHTLLGAITTEREILHQPP